MHEQDNYQFDYKAESIQSSNYLSNKTNPSGQEKHRSIKHKKNGPLKEKLDNSPPNEKYILVFFPAVLFVFGAICFNHTYGKPDIFTAHFQKFDKSHQSKITLQVKALAATPQVHKKSFSGFMLKCIEECNKDQGHSKLQTLTICSQLYKSCHILFVTF